MRFGHILRTCVFALCAHVTAGTPSDFFRHSKNVGDLYELWDYLFIFDNGTRAYLTYSLVNLPAVGPKIAAELSFSNWKGKHYSVGKQFPPQEWKEESASMTIRIREGYRMSGNPGSGHRVLFSTGKKGGYFLDVRFAESVPAMSGPRVDTIFGSPFHMLVHIPHGQVSGTIAVGSDTLPVRGVGMLIHTWHKKRINEFASLSVHLKGLDANAPNGRIFRTPQGKAFGYAIVAEAGNPLRWTPQSVQLNNNLITISWRESPGMLNIDISKTRQKYSALSTVDNWMERQAAKLALGGEPILRRGSAMSPWGPLDWVVTGTDL